MTDNPYEDCITADLRGVEATATQLLEGLKAGTCPHGRQAIHRWARSKLNACVTWERPPPTGLAALIGFLLIPNPDRPHRRRSPKFREAARHLVKHPDATPTQVANAIKHKQYKQISDWMLRPDFKALVQIHEEVIRCEQAQRRLAEADALLEADEAARGASKK